MPKRGTGGLWYIVLMLCLGLGLTAGAPAQSGQINATHHHAQPELGRPMVGRLAEAQIASKFGITQWSLHDIQPLPPRAGDINIRIPLGDHEYDLVLSPHSIRAENFRILLCQGDGTLIEAPAPPESTYRGHIPGLPEARIAATIENGQLSAIVMLDGARQHMHGLAHPPKETWYIQPLTSAIEDAPAPMHIVYSAAHIPDDGHGCGGGVPTFLPPPPRGGGGGGGSGGGPDNTRICQIAIDADFKYYQQNNSSVSATTSDITAVINNAALIYEAESNISFEITEIVVRTTNWPYISGVMSSNLLNQFRNHWNANHTATPRDVAHLFTGITTSDSAIIGLAWVEVVCNQSMAYGYSRSRYTTNTARRTALTAHEIGHNFSAVHCNESGSVCAPCDIMCSAIGGCGGSSSSLGCSAGIIADYANSLSCLTVGCITPGIASQPESRNVEAGESVQFSITAGGTSPLTYRWRRNGVTLSNGSAISGATSPTLTINPAATGHAGDYTCVVTGPCGSTTSNIATLTVNSCTPPAITTQPVPRHASIGSTAEFAITATGDGLTYRWRRNGVNLNNGGGIAGAATPTLTIDPIAQSHAGDYTCLIIGQCGEIESSAASLTVSDCHPPAITSQPQSTAAALGAAAQFAITATGDDPLQYQWRRNGAPLSDGPRITGASTPNLAIEPLTAADDGEYTCLITNECGHIISSAATLTVVIPPVITNHPNHTDVCTGDRITLIAAATGSGPLTYQWRRDGIYLGPGPNRSGTDSPTLIIDPATEDDRGLYTVTVSNSAGSIVSQPALVSVRPGLAITHQPEACTIPSGRRATFEVITDGITPTSYRWRRNGQDLENSDTVFGTNTPRLTINPAQPADAGQYTLRIQHSCGTTISAAATLTITEPEPSTIAFWRFEEGRDGDGAPGEMRQSGRAPSEVNSPTLDAHRYRGDPRYTTDTPGPELAGIGANNLALRFSGEDALRVTTSSLLDFNLISSAGGEFTIEMFARLEPVSGGQTLYPLLDKAEPGGPGVIGYQSWVWAGDANSGDEGRLSGLMSDNSGRLDYLQTQRIDNNQWRHLAWRRYFDGETVRTDLWVDYERQSSLIGEAAGDLSSIADLLIGRTNSGGAYLKGTLDEIRISSRPLHASEFLRIGAATPCYADCDSSGGANHLSAADFTCFVNQFTLAQSLPHAQQVGHYANCDNSTIAPVLNIDDFACFLARFAAGCE